MEGLLAPFQADLPNINICQELTQRQGCKIVLLDQGARAVHGPGRDRRQRLGPAGGAGEQKCSEDRAQGRGQGMGLPRGKSSLTQQQFFRKQSTGRCYLPSTHPVYSS